MDEVEGSRESIGRRGEAVACIVLLEILLLDVVNRFDGKVDLEDLKAGKLRDEGGAPRLGRAAPDLLDLALSSSPTFTDTSARLSLYPTVSTFAQPCYKGTTARVVGFVITTSGS